jgi:hypothetical protein
MKTDSFASNAAFESAKKRYENTSCAGNCAGSRAGLTVGTDGRHFRFYFCVYDHGRAPVLFGSLTLRKEEAEDWTAAKAQLSTKA